MLRNLRSRGRCVVVEGRKSWREEYLLRISGFLPQVSLFLSVSMPGAVLVLGRPRRHRREVSPTCFLGKRYQSRMILGPSRYFQGRSFTPHRTHRAPEGCGLYNDDSPPLRE